ncbi:MAG: hypothetical protein M3071_11905 [Actinomycetota bacterium]|nr:hypothetical protein [Actinomycetota bacterium]
MAKVPLGGQPDLTGGFDGLFTSGLVNLEAAWRKGGPPAAGQNFLQNAVNVMFSLQDEAVKLMQMPAPSGGNYGPDLLMPSPNPYPR